MKHIFTISLCFLALSLSAQETITYPYNPDGDADGLVAVPDLQDILAVYGSPFSPAEIMVGDTALSEWIQILYQALQDQQAVIESMQGAGGCNYAFPEGLDGEGIVWAFTASNSYTVPDGKNLYVTNIYSDNYNNKFKVDGLTVRDGNTNNSESFIGGVQDYSSLLTNPILVSSGQVIIQENTGGLTQGGFSGILIEPNDLEIITHCLCPHQCNLTYGSSYTVPLGKRLYILNLHSGDMHGDFLIDDILVKTGRTNNDAANNIYQPIVVNSGMTVTSTSQSAQGLFNGYLVDEDYFADCGGASTSNTPLGNSGIITTDDLCIDADNALVINFLNGSSGAGAISGIEMDDASNIYIAISGHGHPNNSPGGGEVRKYDVDLNLIWTRVYSSKSPMAIKYQNGGLFVSGFQSWQGDDFVSRINLINGNDLWSHDLSMGGVQGNLLDVNNSYAVYMTYNSGGYSNGWIFTFDFTTGTQFSVMTNAGYPNNMHVNNNTIYFTGYSNGTILGTFDISYDGSVSSNYSYGNFSVPSTPRDWMFSNGEMIKFSNPSGSNAYPQEQNISYIQKGVNNSLDQSFKTGIIDYFYNSNYADNMAVLKPNINGFSIGIGFSKKELNFLSQVLIVSYSDFGYAILDLDMNFNLIGVKNLSTLADYENVQYGVSSTKHAVCIETENNICINGDEYSGIVLLIY